MRHFLFLLLTIFLASAANAQAGSITISITTTTAQSGVAAGTVTFTEPFSDAGLVNAFGNWLIGNITYCNAGTVQAPVACTLTAANLNTAFQAWASQFVSSTQTAVQKSQQNAAAATAAAAIGPVN